MAIERWEGRAKWPSRKMTPEEALRRWVQGCQDSAGTARKKVRTLT
ncbi:MAG: hypothetical protein KGK07_13420 [Chloroflexota bacterium]|nr:hypothetical protein [Chloroflexota bacterium]